MMTERVYLENPYLRQLDARITEKEYINDKYYIKMDKTIFYPNLAGGQPGDKGTINGVKVLDTYEEEDNIIHVIEENIHSDKVSLSINWDNRFDYMQQHSGQHLLSSAFYKLFNAETLGFYMGTDHVYIDIDLEYLTESSIEKVEKFANKIIFSNFPIKSYVIEKDKIKDIKVEQKDDYKSSSIRIIEIDGIDFAPCCGTHLRNTGEIGLIKIRTFEKIKDGIRVSFVCGGRALDDYSWKNNYLESLSSKLDCKKIDICSNIEALFKSNKELKDNNLFLKERLLKLKTKEIIKDKENFKTLNFINRDIKDFSLDETIEICESILNNDNFVISLNLYNDHKETHILALSDNISVDDILEDIPNQKVDSNKSIYICSSKESNTEKTTQLFFNRLNCKINCDT